MTRQEALDKMHDAMRQIDRAIDVALEDSRTDTEIIEVLGHAEQNVTDVFLALQSDTIGEQDHGCIS